MKDRPGIYLANLRKTWTQRMFGPLLKTDCCDNSTSKHNDYSCACNSSCTIESYVVETPVTDQPGGNTIQSLSAGETARIEELYLPAALKKRMLSMGLTNGAKIAVISKEGGRMIVAVRDSRLGLSSEMAAKITCKPPQESIELCQ